MFSAHGFADGVKKGLSFYSGTARHLLLAGVQNVVAALDYEACAADWASSLREAEKQSRKTPSPRLISTVQELKAKLSSRDEQKDRLVLQLKECCGASDLAELRTKLHSLIQGEPCYNTRCEYAEADLQIVIFLLDDLASLDPPPVTNALPVELDVFGQELVAIWDLRTRFRRWDRREGFSTNYRGEIWIFNGYGLTRKEDRIYVHGWFRVVDNLALIFRQFRPEGGRFVIDAHGASYCNTSVGWTRFANFQIVD